MKQLLLCIAFLTFAGLGIYAYAQTGPCPGGAPLAFEGAEGAGRCSQGGRGGPVVNVTSLADDKDNPQPGTLRHCLETMSGPRICRPVVSGWVDLAGYDIVIRHDFVTLEPASDVQMGVKRAGIMVRANHTIIRHFRVRPGTYQLLERVPPQNANGIFWMSREETGEHTHDNICDHCSISWGTDDLAGVIFGATNVTVQDSIIAEGLECIQCGGKGFGMGGNAMKADVIRSLFTNTYIRWPEISHGRARFINTVEYNTNGTPAQINPIYEALHIAFIGNHFQTGPNSEAWPKYPPIRTLGGLAYSASSSIYVEGNYGRYWNPDGSGTYLIGVANPPKNIIWGDNGGITVDASPATHFSDFPAVSVLDHQAAYDDVLDHAGAFPRDSTDTRIVNEVRTNTGRWKESVADAGGWPVLTGGTTTPPPPPPPPPPPSPLVVAPATVEPGGSIMINHNVAPCMSTDWIAIYKPAQSGEGYESWRYVASCPGSVTMTAPSEPGTYKIRYMPDNTYNVVAEIDLTVGNVQPPPPPPPPLDGLHVTSASIDEVVITFKPIPFHCPNGISTQQTIEGEDHVYKVKCER